MYAVRRHQTHYSLAVTNCGDGLVRVFPNSKSRTTVCPYKTDTFSFHNQEYHPIAADPLLDGFKYMHTVLLEDIDPGTLLDASLWALLYRPLIFPGPGKKQSETIYTKVLPFLNKRPLMASVGVAGGGTNGVGSVSSVGSVSYTHLRAHET